MYGTFLGIPIAIAAFLAITYYLNDTGLLKDNAGRSAVGAAVALLLYYLARGIDLWQNKKRDNPAPLYVPKSLPETFGGIREVITETNYGPFFWGVKTVDQDDNRLMGTLTFTEMLGIGFDGSPPIQATRQMMLQVLLEPVPEEEQKEVAGQFAGEKGQTKIELKWLIDSPCNRHTVNKIQDHINREIKQSLGLWVPEKKKERGPFEPPDWVFWVVGLLLFYGVTRMGDEARVKSDREAEIKYQQDSHDWTNLSPTYRDYHEQPGK